MATELLNVARVREAARDLSALVDFVHPALRPHLVGVIEFAQTWHPSHRISPRSAYDATQYPMEEAAHLGVAQSDLLHNRAACLGGMAVFFEAFRQARLDGLVPRSPSGIADLSDTIWDEFREALDASRN